MLKFVYSLFSLAFVLSACALTSQQGSTDFQQERGISTPTVLVDASLLPQTREEACRSIDDKAVYDTAVEARTAGMLQPDFEAIRDSVKKHRIIATFRNGNQACLPHLAAGVQSKPHALLQKTWDKSNLLPQDEQKAGLVSNLMKKPPKGEKASNPQLSLYKGEPVTCDYDMMDLAESGGERIQGESTREMEIRNAFNRSIPPTSQGHRDRIMHGSQAGYRDYTMIHTEESVIEALLKPEAPLTAFSNSGMIYRLETIESVINFYRCFQIPLLSVWDVEMEDRSSTPTKRIRLH